MKELLSTNIGRLRIVAFIEGVSYLILLFVAMPLKYLYGQPAMVKSVGMAHGVLFVAFAVALVLAAFQHRWGFVKILKIFVSSLVPFGTFVADKWIRA
jgi:integral membrane protein